MNFGRKIASLIILTVACGDDGMLPTGTTATTPTSASTTNPATTNNPPTSDTDDVTSTTSTETDATSTSPTTGTTSVEGGPMFLSFSTNVATLTQDESVVFTAILTDPDGVEDIVGGSLRNGDESLEFGPFVAAGQPGTYSISLTWAQIHQTAPIEFEGGTSPRMFRAVFFDQNGLKATDDVTLELQCAGGAACGGACTELAVDGLNCGACGHSCDAGEGACESGSCAPTWSRCVNYNEGLETCAAICQEIGETCVENGCLGENTAVYFDTLDQCESSGGPAYSEILCGEMHAWDISSMAVKCCCTDTK